MKTLITHINPHLDDIAAIWLLKKFYPGFDSAQVEFISAGEGNKGLKESEDTIYIGVGRGRFDEHKGDLADCATSLVWKHLLKENLGPKDEIEKLSLDEIVAWVTMGDLGKLGQERWGDFSVPAFIRPSNNSPETSLKSINLGGEILEMILVVIKRKQRSIKDWQKRIEFQSKFGKTYAVQSASINRAFCNSQDGDVYLMYDPDGKSVQYYTPKYDLDLAPIYQKLIEIDGSASWYLHQSHHMVICGSGSAPDSKPTKLSFKQLIDMVKSI